MTPSATELGRFIRYRRLTLGLSQTKLAQAIRCPQAEISSFETGKYKRLNSEQTARCAQALRCDPEELRKLMPDKRVAQATTEVRRIIRARREELGLSLADFAQRLEVTLAAARGFEISARARISFRSARRLAAALDLEPRVLAQFVSVARSKPTTSRLGQLVRTHRREQAMSMRQLAYKLDVTPSFVSQIELGQASLSASNVLIARLARVLEIKEETLAAVRPPRKLKRIESRNPLGGFLAARRLELHLTQRAVSEHAHVSQSSVNGVETGRYLPCRKLLAKLSQALDCEIPPELVPGSKKRGRPRIR